jgi:NO-binding membrane sensor protein with MHYT domain
VTAAGSFARFWLLGGALAMGFGIWSMHFVAMLAFSLPVPLAYDPAITMASLVIAIATSGTALAVVAQLATVSETEIDIPILVAGGVIMGAGICGMHYTGMAAMRMTPPIQYTPYLFGLSMLIAVTASLVALWLAFTLRAGKPGTIRRQRMAAAFVMGLAISGMHYTAMAAAKFAPGAMCAANGVFSVDSEALGYLLAGVSVTLLGGALALPRSLRVPVPSLQ